MLNFLSNFLLLLVALVAAVLIGWFVVRSLRQSHGRHRGRRHHHSLKLATTTWLPIDTFDETEPAAQHVLLWVDGEARFGFYDHRSSVWREQAEGDRSGTIHPTHWMPLPRPPGS